jgi:ribosomal RNA-processing protein 8
VIADLGCGDGGLAQALVPRGKVVLSYDLVGSEDGWVVEADFLDRVPLPGRKGSAESGSTSGSKGAASEVVDVVVCCLSLMGLNWLGGIYEACRILKHGFVFPPSLGLRPQYGR